MDILKFWVMPIALTYSSKTYRITSQKGGLQWRQFYHPMVPSAVAAFREFNLLFVRLDISLKIVSVFQTRPRKIDATVR